MTGQANLGLSWSKADTYESPDMAKYENSKLADKGRYSLATGNGLSTDGKIVINYGKSLDTKGSMFRISAGSNIQYSRKQNASFIATGFIKDELSDLSFALAYPTGHPSGSDKVSTGVGVFANANFSLWNRYFVDGSYRASCSSKFGSRNSFAPFWAFGAGWHLHNEKFIKDNLPWLNTFTFVYSMGYTGSVSFDYYQARTVYQYDSKYQYVSGIGALHKQMGNRPQMAEDLQQQLRNHGGLPGQQVQPVVRLLLEHDIRYADACDPSAFCRHKFDERELRPDEQQGSRPLGFRSDHRDKGFVLEYDPHRRSRDGQDPEDLR